MQWGWKRSSLAVCAAALGTGALLWMGSSSPADATQEFALATIERAGPVAPRSVWTVQDPQVVFELERELGALPPSTAGFPRWLIHVFSGTERQRSFAVFDEDLPRFPTVARAVQGQIGSERYLYRVELPGPYWEDSERVVARLAGTGARPVFYSGARSNWPYVEVILTERVEAGLPIDPVPADQQEARARFMERVGPLLRNKTRDKTLDASYERLANQLYVYHRELTTQDDVSQFATRYRRYGISAPKR